MRISLEATRARRSPRCALLIDDGSRAAPWRTSSPRERRRGAQRTNEIKRERAAKRRQAAEEAAGYGEAADKLLLLDVVARLQQELHCSDCRVALAAAELLLKYLLGPPGRTEEPGLLAPALAFAERMEQGGAHALFTALSPKPSAPAVEDVEDLGEERVTRLEAALGTSTGLSTPVRRADRTSTQRRPRRR